jgi:uncharacterized membrane protein
MAINKNTETRKIRTYTDRISNFVTRVTGSMPFLVINVGFFVFWILLNVGLFGHSFIVDKYPFSFLTTTVSIEAILLSTFVIMSQRREAKLSEARTELDYHSDLKAEVDIKTIVSILERIAEKQGVDVADLLADMKRSEVVTLNKAVRDEANSQ